MSRTLSKHGRKSSQKITKIVFQACDSFDFYRTLCFFNETGLNKLLLVLHNDTLLCPSCANIVCYLASLCV